MLKDFIADLFDGRNRSKQAVAEALGVNEYIAAAILIGFGYVVDHIGVRSGKTYYRPA